MVSEKNDYHISFFRPTTPRALHNRNMVLWLVSIWAVAIFGFQIALYVLEKPTPEPELTAFEKVWENVKAGNASIDEIKTFAHSTLHVAGKVFIASEHRAALDNGISWATMQLADSAQKVAIGNALIHFEEATSNAKLVTDDHYVTSKLKLKALVQPVIGLQPGTVLSEILPLELNSSLTEVITEENKAIIEACMPLYTIHNRSVLTDTKFLGFPFHYFYTAVFLLILFIGLCYAYCVRVDAYNKRMSIAD
ncbi:MAG: DUF4212 domain-containing protein [Prolixibacteraceae bacterium]|jgi:putative solute:sodium symporter small subunit|nr:DUF4212 domain-containing protein [Prolixibacteraceae bacterium]